MAGRHLFPGPESLRTILHAHEVLMVYWAPHHAISINGMRFVTQKHNPVHEMLTRRWNTRTDPFWWHCLISASVGGPKATVRGWLRRRAAAAIIESLRKNGYAKDGSRFPSEVGASGGDLVGTATFFVGKKLCRTSWKDLQEKSDLLITKIIKKTRDGQRKPFDKTWYGDRPDLP